MEITTLQKPQLTSILNKGESEMFKKGQKVQCAMYGAGVVENVLGGPPVGYPVAVKFECGSLVSYTAKGEYQAGDKVVLFPRSFEIA